MLMSEFFRVVNPFFILLFIGSTFASCSTFSASPEKEFPVKKEFSAWTFLGPDSSVWVRAILPENLPENASEKNCPTLTVDSQSIPMKVRSFKVSAAFPVLVCEAQISPTAQRVEMNKKVLPSPVLNPQRIVILGDTGCVIKAAHGTTRAQACNDPKQWPFAQIAQAAAKLKPDLVVHVGDYHYRESSCPASQESCKGSISGDRWESWGQDFFTPAEPLLKAAPWVFTRGNHEICARAGEGWFRFLETRPALPTCSDRMAPYTVRLAGLSLAMIDAADDLNISPSLAKLSQSLQGGEWLVLHRPFLTPGADHGNQTQATLPPQMEGPGKIGAVLAGHQHRLSLNQFSDSRPPELITGNGGALLDRPSDRASNKGTSSLSEFSSTLFDQFGFITLDRQPDSTWLLTVRDTQGNSVTQCNLKQEQGKKTQLICK